MDNKGFSLAELLVTLTIIGILTAVAVPAYDDYIYRGFGEDAKGEITSILFAQEQHFIENQEYSNTLSEVSAIDSITHNGQTIYAFSLQGCGSGGTSDYSDCVQVTATANGRQVNYGTLRANSLGERKYVGGKNDGQDW